MTNDNPTFSELKKASGTDSSMTFSRTFASNTIVFEETACATPRNGDAGASAKIDCVKATDNKTMAIGISISPLKSEFPTPYHIHFLFVKF